MPPVVLWEGLDVRDELPPQRRWRRRSCADEPAGCGDAAVALW